MNHEDRAIDGIDAEEKVFGFLSYLSLLCIVPLLMKRESDFVLFHAKQGLILFLGQVALFVLSTVFPWVVRPGAFILSALAFWGIVEVLCGHKTALPVVSHIAEKISL